MTMQMKPDQHPMPGKPAAVRTVNVYIDGYNFYVPLSTMDAHGYELAWCDFLKLAQAVVGRLAGARPSEFGNCLLGAVKYFTATIPDDMPKDRGGIERKHLWLDALHSHSQGQVEVTHGTFRARKHRFYIEAGELDQLARGGIPINWELLGKDSRTFHPKLEIHEEKQTDMMLGCSLVTDAALGFSGAQPRKIIQKWPLHRSNTRATPSPCQAAIVISADIDFLPAAEIAAEVFQCPVAIAFAYPHVGFELSDLLPHPIHGLLTTEISEPELRQCVLPEELILPDGRTITFQRFKSSHFARVKATGG